MQRTMGLGIVLRVVGAVGPGVIAVVLDARYLLHSTYQGAIHGSRANRGVHVPRGTQVQATVSMRA